MNGDVLHQTTQNCMRMAAGSDSQPIKAHAVLGKSGVISNSITRISGVRNHFPYPDHNYGKPLTPPYSNSPDHLEEPDTGNEDEGVTRCICGFDHDDGCMICCDRCSAWQHMECVGVESNSVPETYLCDLCHPRALDVKRAIQIQTKKKKEDFTDEEDDDGDVSDHDSDNALSRASLPNPASMKENVLTKGKRKKRESARKLNQKEMKHNKRKRRKRKHIGANAIPVDEDTNGAWNITPYPEHKQYQEAHTTMYVGDFESRPFPHVEQSLDNFSNCVQPKQMCKVVEVQKNKKGVVVTEDTTGQQFIIECKGNLMFESKFKEDHPMFSKCDPFVLFYTKLQLVMNFSAYGNDARFIRRSCSPTAEVRHVTVDKKPRLVIYSMSPLAKGTEVTLAFEFPFREYRHQLDCACAQENCMVQKHNMAIQKVEQTNGYRINKDEHGLVDSSLSNHMDSDSDGDNGASTNDKRSRKKLSREDRKLQAYLRQIEKMEKTEKKKQGRTGILTPRNYAEELNGETPSKPGKVLRKQGVSQRHQRKIQNIRRGSRLLSCSSEPLSPEDNCCSSAASTPTTPCVIVTEENCEIRQNDMLDKSFKFPKFKGSLTDVSSANIDARSTNASPETTGYVSPSKPPFEAGLAEIDDSNCEHNCISGLSPRTDTNCSPSPCHSTYASPTHCESVDLSEMVLRHEFASPSDCSVASYILNQGQYKVHYTHTTLKKRWLLKYMNERSENKRLMPNGVIADNFLKPRRLSWATSTPRTFPLPYKRRKLMEYEKTLNILAPSSRSIETSTLPSSGAKNVINSIVGLSSTVHTSTTSSASAVTSSTMMSSNVVTTSREPLLLDARSVSSNSQNHPGDDEAGYHQVTGSEEANWRRRISGGSDDTSLGRSSLSSISSTDDVRMDITPGDAATFESKSSNIVDSSSEACRRASVTSETVQAVSEPPSGRSCVTGVVRDDTSRDAAAHVGSSGGVDGTAGSTMITSGGKRKIPLSEYLNRKRTGVATSKKENTSSTNLLSPSQSRISDARTGLADSNTMSSAGHSADGLSIGGTRVYSGAVLASRVSSSTGASAIEPVSPGEESHLSRSCVQDSRTTSAMVSGTKSSPMQESPHRLSSLSRPHSEAGNSGDAMEIEDDDVPSSSNILLNTPIVSLPGARSAVVASSNKNYSPQSQSVKFSVISAQLPPVRQVMNGVVTSDNYLRQPGLVPGPPQLSNSSIQSLPRRPDFRTTSDGPSPFH